jgi:protoheme IX farnesyltransferase
MMNLVKEKFLLYWSLIKSLQTSLLLATGLAGYMTVRCPITHWTTILSITGSLFLAISGSTVLNMWYDRDLDGRMLRTRRRPLPAGRVSSKEALALGLVLSAAGVGWSLALDKLFGGIIIVGFLFDVVIYTIWLKRRTPWSIVWGGISGGMPILAGRALGVGSMDWIGLLLALAVLLWIPTHILTFSMRHFNDYQMANIPTFPSCYGFKATRLVIAASSLFAATAIGLAALGIGITWGYLRVLIVLSCGMLGLALGSLARPSERTNFGLFKYASLYMLSAMVLLIL